MEASETPKSGNKKTLIIVAAVIGGLLLVCCIAAVVISAMSQSWLARFSDEFNTQFEKYEDEFKDYENNLNDLSGDDDSVSIFGKDWPSEIPASVPKFSAGRILNATDASLNSSAKIWIITVEDATQDDINDYKQQMKNNDWKIDLDITENFFAASYPAEKLQVQVTYDAKGSVITITQSSK